MACPGCRGKKASGVMSAIPSKQVAQTSRSTETVNVMSTNIPLEMNGKILAQYIGGQGQGKHYYQGVKSKERHRVKYGDFVYANPVDVKDPSNQVNTSLLVRVVRDTSPVQRPAPALKPVPVPKAIEQEPQIEQLVPERSPRRDVVRTPVTSDVNITKVEDDLPDIHNLTTNQIRAMGDEITPDMARRLVTIEENDLNRTKVVNWLKQRASS